MKDNLDNFVQQFSSYEAKQFIYNTMELIHRLSNGLYTTQDQVYNEMLFHVRNAILEQEGQEVLMKIFLGRGEAL